MEIYNSNGEPNGAMDEWRISFSRVIDAIDSKVRGFNLQALVIQISYVCESLVTPLAYGKGKFAYRWRLQPLYNEAPNPHWPTVVNYGLNSLHRGYAQQCFTVVNSLIEF